MEIIVVCFSPVLTPPPLPPRGKGDVGPSPSIGGGEVASPGLTTKLFSAPGDAFDKVKNLV